MVVEASMGLTMKEKKALTKELARRYRQGTKETKTKILDEFVRTTGYNRKYAIHVLANYGLEKIRYIDGKAVKVIIGQQPRKKRKGNPRYGPEVKKAVTALWKFFDYMCGKRLVVLIRTNIELLCCQPELKITESIKESLMRISASTVDRMLAGERKKRSVKGRSHTKHGPLLKHQIPIRTEYTWDERLAGFFELDTVGHDGGSSAGEFCYTLTATDVFSGWTEVRALRNRAHRWVKEQVEQIASTLPFPLKGIDSDNGGEFINHTLWNYCNDEQIEFTRGRPYRKNDNCFVEQKNDLVVRRTVGYYRFDTDEEFEALQEVYQHLCPLINYFYPSHKIIAKERIGAKVKKTYDDPKPPAQRLLEADHIHPDIKHRLRKEMKNIHIIKQKKKVDQAVRHLLRLYGNKKQIQLFA
jgi:hypothetical protein